MVWSACIVVPPGEKGAAIAASNPNNKFILRRVRLPCPYRVQMSLPAGRFRSERTLQRRPYMSNDATVTSVSGCAAPETGTLLPPITSAPSRPTTLVRSTGTAASDVAFVERIRQTHQTQLLLAVKEFQRSHAVRLAAEQLALRQQYIRAGERKAVEKACNFRVKGRFSALEKEDELNFEPQILQYPEYYSGDWFSYEEIMADDNMGGGYVPVVRLNSAQRRIRERLRRADQKARSRLVWSDTANRWVTVRERGDTSAFWSFVNHKKTYGWYANPSRFHDCNCTGHCIHHNPDEGNLCRCKICVLRWEYFEEFMRKMRERLRLLREGKMSKDEMKRAQIAEAEKMRQLLMRMGEAERLRKLAEAKARQAGLSPPLKRHENTKITPQRIAEADDEDEVIAWNESDEEELIDLAREEADEDLMVNRPELDFQDKMYESAVVDEEVPVTPPSPPKAETSFVFQERTPTPSTPEPVKLPTPPPPQEKKEKKVSFKLPKKKPSKPGKKKKTKPVPPPPVSPIPPKKETPPPTPPPREPSESPDFIFESPPPPLNASAFGQRKIILEEADDDEPKRRPKKLPATVEDDYDFVVIEDKAPSPEPPEEPAKTKLQRPANWGAPSTLMDELSFRPSKSASKRRALDRAIAERQKAARGRKPKKAAEQGEPPLEEEEAEPLDLDWLDQFYYIQDNTIANRCRYAFQANDTRNKGRLDLEESLRTLCRVNPELSDAETFYIERVLELFGADMNRGVDLRLFTVMGAFSLRLTALDDWLRTMVNEIDFRLLEYKIDFCKRLWLTCTDDTKYMSEDQFRVLLLAGGVTAEHELSACTKLFATRPMPHRLDMLDFLSYIPLFIAIHLSISYNPMDDSRTK